MESFGLGQRLGIPTEEAALILRAYFEAFPNVKDYMDRVVAEARDRGYTETLFGRRRQIPELKARNWGVRSLGERLAVNTPIQGTAADVIKLAMIGCARALDDESLQTRLILTIHDELLFEGPPEEVEGVKALVEREMVAPWGDRDPPLAVDVGVGETWLEAK